MAADIRLQTGVRLGRTLPRMRPAVLVALGLALLLSSSPVRGGAGDPRYRLASADSLLLSHYLARIAHCPSVSLYAVAMAEPECEKYPVRAAAMIACHEIVRQIPSVTSSQRDSLVALLSRPGAIGRCRPKLTIAPTDFVVRFTSETDTLLVWGVLSEGYLWFSAKGLPILAAGHDPILSELGGLIGWRFVSPTHRPGDFHDRLDSTTADQAPRLRRRPDTPIELLIRPGTPADTVWLEARIPLRGMPHPVNILNGVGGRVDSVVVEFVKKHSYYPAMIGKRPVHTWIRLGIPVPALGG